MKQFLTLDQGSVQISTITVIASIKIRTTVFFSEFFMSRCLLKAILEMLHIVDPLTENEQFIKYNVCLLYKVRFTTKENIALNKFHLIIFNKQ